MFSGFQHENFSVKVDSGEVSKETFFHQFLSMREMDPLDMPGQNPDSAFWEILHEQVPGGGSPKDGGFILWKFRSAKLYKWGRASKNTLLPGVPETGQVDLAFAQAGLFL
ncbi:hypothetical protein OIU77_015308 [Salix suchowensis]|uniref:Uncharacterized protein n=1 Tax=Salix suchowensis TaxID=1278906 RepID=A0ABQ8ZSY2_9ROSI|nr:hypothetical protein OIU77_015308 [Salix suchowensis]